VKWIIHFFSHIITGSENKIREEVEKGLGKGVKQMSGSANRRDANTSATVKMQCW
jgi:hypothetical protein